jgi:hypothetical protein
MKKIIVLGLLLTISIAAFKIWEKFKPPTFTLKMIDGKTVQVSKLLYKPIIGFDSYGGKEFSLQNKIGTFKVLKDLRDVQSIEVLDKSGESLKVTFTSGDSLTGNRKSSLDKYIIDNINGECGKIEVSISVDELVSITRN